jgi:apolipoprotein N-acyltransferase
VSYYDKFHLVPFGEYVPLRGILPFDKFVPFADDIVAGPGPQTIYVDRAMPAGPLVCYEIIFSGEVVDKKRRPSWLVNITNDGWYGISSGPHQHFAMAQTRAVEEGLPVARAAYTGISGIMDPYGRIVASLPLGEEGVVDARLPMEIAPTVFALFGNKVPLSLAGLLILMSLFAYAGKRDSKNNA